MKYDDISDLNGQKITGILMSPEYLVFEHATGKVGYLVEGDCCSCSYFYDFHGVEKLFQNGPVVSTKAINLDAPDDDDARKGEVVAAYGFEIVTEHPTWGEQTSVFSFRNDSNGYYGGTLYRAEDAPELAEEHRLTTDCLQVHER